MKSITLLVVGTREFDSGKTTFSIALLSILRKHNIRAIGFKPLAAHECIEQYDLFMKNLSEGKLYGHDAYYLWKYSFPNLPIEIINPADILTKRDLEFSEKSVEIFDHIAVGRFSFHERESIRNYYYYRKGIKDKLCLKLLEKLKPSGELIEISSYKEFLELHEKYYQKSVESMFNFIKEKSDVIVIESFNDALYPAKEVEEASFIFACNLNNVYVYKNEQFKEILKNSKNSYMLRFQDIRDKITPYREINLPLFDEKIVENEELLKEQVNNYKLSIEKFLKEVNLIKE